MRPAECDSCIVVVLLKTFIEFWSRSVPQDFRLKIQDGHDSVVIALYRGLLWHFLYMYVCIGHVFVSSFLFTGKQGRSATNRNNRTCHFLRVLHKYYVQFIYINFGIKKLALITLINQTGILQ